MKIIDRFFKRFEDYTTDELELIKEFNESPYYLVVKKVIDIRLHNILVENIGGVAESLDGVIANEIKRSSKQGQAFALKSLLRVFEDMKKEAEKREKKRKDKDGKN